MNVQARLAALLFLMALAFLAAGSRAATSQSLEVPSVQKGRTVERSFAFGGRERCYLLRVPASYDGKKPLPLILAFHGGYGTAEGEERLTGLSALGEKKGFIVAYPQGIARSWSDGRDSLQFPRQRLQTDDIGFVEELVRRLMHECRIDSRRIYATGISNGAIFSFHLAAHSSIVAAIAPVAGGIPKPDAAHFAPSRPISVLVINGDADPLVPYDGGQVARDRGEIVGAEASALMWARADGCALETTKTNLPDTADDGCTATRIAYPAGKDGVRVEVIRIKGGGHTWPGGPQYLPVRLIGKVCRDFNASEVIWEFFSSTRW